MNNVTNTAQTTAEAMRSDCSAAPIRHDVGLGGFTITQGLPPPVVAIIDDDADLRASVAALLAENGFAPLPLPDGGKFHSVGA